MLKIVVVVVVGGGLVGLVVGTVADYLESLRVEPHLCRYDYVEAAAGFGSYLRRRILGYSVAAEHIRDDAAVGYEGGVSQSLVHHIGDDLVESLVGARCELLKALTLGRTDALSAAQPLIVVLALGKLVDALVLEFAEIELAEVLDRTHLGVGEEYLGGLGAALERRGVDSVDGRVYELVHFGGKVCCALWRERQIGLADVYTLFVCFGHTVADNADAVAFHIITS